MKEAPEAARAESAEGHAASSGRGSSLRRVAARGGAIVVSSRLVIQVVSILVNVLLARLLLPYDYGILTAGSIFLSLGDIFTEGGIAKALVQKPKLDEHDLAEAFTLNLVLSLLIYALLFLIAGPAATFLQSPELAAFVRVSSLVLLLIPFRSVPGALMERRLEMGRLSAIYVVTLLFQFSVVLVLAFAGFGFWALAAGTLAGRTLEAACLLRQTAWAPRLRLSSAWSSPIVSFGLSWSGSRLCWFIYRNADYAILGRLLGPVALGHYSLAFMLITLPVEKLGASCNLVAYPIFCRLGHDPERVRSWFLRLCVLLGFLGTPVLVGLALVASDAIPLILGPKWGPAVVPFQLMSLAGVFMLMGTAMDGLLNALGRPDVNFRFTLASVCLYPVLFFVMGRQFGITGVALVWAAVYPLMVLVLVRLTSSITGVGIRHLVATQAPIWAAAAVMCLAVLATRLFLGAGQAPALRLAACVAAGVVGYGVGILLLARESVLGNVRVLWSELRSSR